MHIHPSSPNSSQSEESAATKIQAGFRGYRVRKQLKQKSNNSRQHRNQMELKNGLAPRTKDSRNNSGSSDCSSIEEKCATKIQAGVRGFLVRKRQKHETDAATKIQASFRGFKVRKEVQKLKQK